MGRFDSQYMELGPHQRVDWHQSGGKHCLDCHLVSDEDEDFFLTECKTP